MNKFVYVVLIGCIVMVLFWYANRETVQTYEYLIPDYTWKDAHLACRRQLTKFDVYDCNVCDDFWYRMIENDFEKAIYTNYRLCDSLTSLHNDDCIKYWHDESKRDLTYNFELYRRQLLFTLCMDDIVWLHEWWKDYNFVS